VSTQNEAAAEMTTQATEGEQVSTQEAATSAPLALPAAGQSEEPARTDEPTQVEGVTVEEAVTLFYVSLSTLRRRLQKGEVPGAVLAPGPKGQAWRIPPASLEGLGYKAKQVREVEVKAAQVSAEAENLEAQVRDLKAALDVERVLRESAQKEAELLRTNLEDLRTALAKLPAALPPGKPSRWWRRKEGK
jgi:hypothetical protein